MRDDVEMRCDLPDRSNVTESMVRDLVSRIWARDDAEEAAMTTPDPGLLNEAAETTTHTEPRDLIRIEARVVIAAVPDRDAERQRELDERYDTPCTCTDECLRADECICDCRA